LRISKPNSSRLRLMSWPVCCEFPQVRISSSTLRSLSVMTGHARYIRGTQSRAWWRWRPRICLSRSWSTSPSIEAP